VTASLFKLLLFIELITEFDTTYKGTVIILVQGYML
jgi:hypothetical protein